MKILHLTPNLNWATIFILPIAEAQRQEKSVIYISSPSCSETVKSSDVKFISLNSKLKNIIPHLLGIFKVMKFVRREKIGKIFFHTSLDSCLYLLCCRLFTKAELVYVNHGVPYAGYYGGVGMLFKCIEISNLFWAHRILSITSSMTQLLEKVNIRKKTINTMLPGTIAGVKFNYAVFELLERKRRACRENNLINGYSLNILYVGRIEKRKGLYDLVQAVNSMSEPCHLTIIGGSDSLFTEAYDSEKITFVDYTDELEKYYLVADVLCVPSHHEGFGQVYLEAASYGVIPICCDILGPTDFIKNADNGFCVPVRSPEAIALLLDQIQTGHYDLKKMRQRAFLSAQQYDASLVIKNNKELFL